MKRPMWNFIYRMLVRFKNRLLALPSKLAMEIAGLENINDIIQIIQKNMLDTLEELSEYDPDEIDQGDVYLPEEDEEGEEEEE